MVNFFKETRATKFLPRIWSAWCSAASVRTNLMLFAEFDLGDILRRGIGSRQPKIVRLVVGNPLIMKEMVKHVP
jgi:hypothetical protein